MKSLTAETNEERPLGLENSLWYWETPNDQRSVTRNYDLGVRNFVWMYEYFPIYDIDTYDDAKMRVLNFFERSKKFKPQGITLYVYFVRQDPYLEVAAIKDEFAEITFNYAAIFEKDTFDVWLRKGMTLRNAWVRDLKKEKIKDGLSSRQE